MHIHVLGICGTFMGSLAVLASAVLICRPFTAPSTA